MTTVDIPTKIHKKLKKEALDRDMDLKDIVAEKLGVIVMIAILAVSGLGIAYAEEQPLPLEDAYDLKYCVLAKVEPNIVRFTCNWDWLIPIEILSQVNQTTPPVNLNDLPIYNLALADMIKLYLEKAKQAEIEEQERIAALPDPEPEPLNKEEREIEAAVKVLAECRTGLGAWAAYQDDELIEHYSDQSRWEFSIRDNLSKSPVIGKMLKAIEECRIMKRYADMNLIGAYELNKVLADQAGLDYLGRGSEHPLAVDVTDQSDTMVETDPVTDKDIADEREDMEQIKQDLIDKRIFEDPDKDFEGINRGGQPEGIKCQIHGQPAPVGIHPSEKCPLSLYDAHILKNWADITYNDILQLQCDNFLYIYQHKIGTHEFPVWLNHCVPKVVREG